MKTYFETPSLRVILFRVRDILTASPEPPETGDDELPVTPKD